MADCGSAKNLSRVPSLRSETSSTTSRSDALTELAEHMRLKYVLESEPDSLSTDSTRAAITDQFPCVFQILDCEEQLDDIVSYKIHIFSHFRGHPLPKQAWCFVCDQHYRQRAEDDDALAWNRVLDHMIEEHFDGSQLVDNNIVIRPHLSLMRWMYNRSLIDDHQLKRAQLRPPPTMLFNRRTERSGGIELPEAPMAPREHTHEPSDLLPPTWTTGYHDQPYVIIAGRRAERRDRNRFGLAGSRFAQTTR